MILFNLNIEQFLSIVIVHFLAVVSPGPDFSIVLKQSIENGKKSGFYTSLGISIGILIHVFFCIVGIGYFISNNFFVYNVIKYLGVLYLLYIGISSFIPKKKNIINKSNNLGYKIDRYLYNPFISGFLTNIFNPKATLFFLSLFIYIIDPDTSLGLQIFYGIWMCSITGIWFCFVSFLISSNYFKKIITEYSSIIDRLLGLVLIYISIKILFL